MTMMATTMGRLSWRVFSMQARRCSVAHNRTSSSDHQKLTNFGEMLAQVTGRCQKMRNQSSLAMFLQVSSKYDLMNDLMNIGLHCLWNDRHVAESVLYLVKQFPLADGSTGFFQSCILFLACNIWMWQVAQVMWHSVFCVQSTRHSTTPLERWWVNQREKMKPVYMCDINPNMLEVGKQCAHEQGLVNVIDLVSMEGDAEALNLEDNSMDAYTIAFGIHNVTHIDCALKEAHRVLRWGR